jgi:hypothetical protein
MKAEPISTSITEALPALPLSSWRETLETLHMWTQIAGKVQMALTPKVNHWWNVTLHVTSRGLATSPIPHGLGSFEIVFDFLEHKLTVELSDGNSRALPLRPQSVAGFYQQFMATLASLGINVKIWTMPCEIPNPIRFETDRVHAAYDADAAQRFWRILLWVDNVFAEFRSRFLGKVSPVHFFWGSFDLAVTRFSGRPAPERPGADSITREAYSHEVSSAGFWAGGGEISAPAFYSYAAPRPEGFARHPVRPKQAFYDAQLGEFLLMYDDVRNARLPKDSLLDFLQSTYEAAAILGKWDRKALER